MDLFRWSLSTSRRAEPAKRRGRLAAALVALVAGATAGSADFRLTDPTSALYYSYGLLAGTKLEVGERGAVTGNAHSNGTLTVRENGRVTGDASAVGKLTNRGTITGKNVSPAKTLVLPVLASLNDLRGLANRVLPGNQRFSNAVINDVVFVEGDVTVRGSLAGTGTIIAGRDLTVEEPDGSTVLGAATRLSLIAVRDLRLRELRSLRGALYAGRDVNLGERTSFEGPVVARRELIVRENATVRFLDLDTTAPALQLLQPGEGALLGTARPTIQASWSDDLSGVAPASVRFRLDGTDRTAQATVSTTGFTFTPASALAEGAHTVDVTLADRSANPAHAVSHFSTDSLAPAVALAGPTEGQVFAGSPISVTGTASDANGVTGVTVNGQPATFSGGAFSATVALTPGANTLTVAATDAAGNSGQAVVHVTLQTDTTAPVVTITGPADGATVNDAALTVTGTATDDGAITGVTVNGQPAALAAGAFSAQVTLVDGANSIIAIATDAAGNSGQAAISVTLQRDVTAPEIALVAPAAGTFVLQGKPLLEVTYSDASGVDTASLAFAVDDVPIAVECALEEQRARCTPTADLPEGSIVLSATVRDRAGNPARANARFTVDTAGLEVAFTEPVEGEITSGTEIAVSGTVSPGSPAITRIEINGVLADLAGGGFSANVPLRDGVNMLVALATKANGRTGAASLTVTRDVAAPIVRITAPRDGFVAIANRIAITGLVNDIVTGGVPTQVQVNGVAAGVMGGSFLATNVELVPGPNVLEAVATDAVGQSGRHQITVVYQPASGNRIAFASGEGQAGSVKAELAEPLVAVVRDDSGLPVSGSLVRFEVTRNSGTLRLRAGDPPQRSLQVPTDGRGEAAVLFTLGDTAGAGNNRVRATGLGVAGEVEFCATAFPDAPFLLAMERGDNQRGVVGRPLPLPLSAFVTDASGNPLAEVPVRFTVVKGLGTLDGGTTVERTTDADGLARAVFTVGPDPGINNNVVAAAVPGLDGLPATFTASGLAPGDPAATRFSGVVLDDGLTPIPNVEISLGGTALRALTDAQGQFRIDGVPVGFLHIHIDPAHAARLESFPPLAFETVTVAGQNNTLGQPILLPRLATENSKLVGGPADVTLTMAGVEGVGLTVFANSATFPDGSRTGFLTISQVHLDKVPMLPPAGGIFMPPTWSIQPPGVHFDPPARITIPNNGLPPGRVIDIFQFEHELNQFVNVGKGTVSEDGATASSDPGFGILAAGWGGGAPPTPPQTCVNGCDDGNACTTDRCVNNSCVHDAQPDRTACTDDQDGCTDDICKAGSCQHINPGIEVTVDDPPNGFDISTAPEMPQVVAHARVTGVDPDPTANTIFRWETNRTQKFCNVRDVEETTQAQIFGGEFRPIFPGIIGGTLKMKATIFKNGKLCASKEVMKTIRGIDPSRADQDPVLGSDLARSIACQESFGGHQFRPSPGGPVLRCEPDGRIGVGILQVTTPSPSDQAFWNWRRNIAEGLAILQAKGADAAGYPGRVRTRRTNPFPAATDFTAEQLRLETIQRFNGGAYWRWNNTTLMWEAHPPNSYVSLVLNCR
jgi:hypothetical protein